VSYTINIISNSDPHRSGGPAKVLANTLRGLQKVGQSYVINQPLADFRRSWIHDNIPVLIEAAVREIPVLAGPNLFVTPDNFPFLLPPLRHIIYLHPSAWTINLWRTYNFNRCELKVWPVGIDWEEFNFPSPAERNEVLLYFKKRQPELKEKAICELKNQGYKINLIEYGSYTEALYKDVLKRSKFGVWIGTTESQGIALQEALAANVPLIVLENQNILDHNRPEKYDLPASLADFKATSVPYFDQTCGIVINDISELSSAVQKMTEEYDRFAPGEYIKQNLSLEKSARQLISYFEELESGIQDNLPAVRKSRITDPAQIGFITALHSVRRNLIKTRRVIRNFIHRF
jgi:hypothetical protein